jgi:hypothetical protein
MESEGKALSSRPQNKQMSERAQDALKGRIQTTLDWFKEQKRPVSYSYATGNLEFIIGCARKTGSRYISALLAHGDLVYCEEVGMIATPEIWAALSPVDLEQIERDNQ